MAARTRKSWTYIASILSIYFWRVNLRAYAFARKRKSSTSLNFYVNVPNQPLLTRRNYATVEIHP